MNYETVIILSLDNLSAAFDADGTEVWCDFADQLAWTNAGHCQFCGSRKHEVVAR